jgi:hypothetical protein
MSDVDDYGMKVSKLSTYKVDWMKGFYLLSDALSQNSY